MGALSDEDTDILANHHDPETGELVFIRQESTYGTEPSGEPAPIVNVRGPPLLQPLLDAVGYQEAAAGATTVEWTPAPAEPCAVCPLGSRNRMLGGGPQVRCSAHEGQHGPALFHDPLDGEEESYQDGMADGLRLGCAERDRVRSELTRRLTRLRTILESDTADPVGMALREMRGWGE